MAGTEKYWIDGLPNVPLTGSGTEKYWLDGLPTLGIESGVAAVSYDWYVPLSAPASPITEVVSY